MTRTNLLFFLGMFLFTLSACKQPTTEPNLPVTPRPDLTIDGTGNDGTATRAARKLAPGTIGRPEAPIVRDTPAFNFVDLLKSQRQQPEADEIPMSLTASDGTGLCMTALAARGVVESPLAFTELHMTFDNPKNRTIEGRFRITLPPSAKQHDAPTKISYIANRTRRCSNVRRKDKVYIRSDLGHLLPLRRGYSSPMEAAVRQASDGRHPVTG